MILDDVHNYDLTHGMGIDLSSFSRDMTYFLCSFIILGGLFIYSLIRAEKTRVYNKNQEKKQIAKEENDKYKLKAKEKFNSLNQRDAQLSSLFENIPHIIETVNHFIYINKNNPIYINFISQSEKTVMQQIYTHNQLLDNLNGGYDIEHDNPVFVNYKIATLALMETYQNMLKLGIKNQPVSDNYIVNINDI